MKNDAFQHRNGAADHLRHAALVRLGHQARGAVRELRADVPRGGPFGATEAPAQLGTPTPEVRISDLELGESGPLKHEFRRKSTQNSLK